MEGHTLETLGTSFNEYRLYRKGLSGDSAIDY